MSGHSKWSTIKRQKGVNDLKKGMTFTKIANAITISARAGNSGDPSANPRLRLPLDQARSVNMPKENIQRAIDRGLGKLPGQTLEEVVYEGFGPAKIALVIEAVTDNKLRTLQEIRNIFDRSGGGLGGSGSSSYMFDKVGEIKTVTKGGSINDEMLDLIDAGAEDAEDVTEDGIQKYLIYCKPQDLIKLSNNITQQGYKIDSSTISLRPNTTTELIDLESAKKALQFIEKLEEHEDVQKVFSNLSLPDHIISSLN